MAVQPDDSAVGLIRGGMVWHATNYSDPTSWSVNDCVHAHALCICRCISMTPEFRPSTTPPIHTCPTHKCTDVDCQMLKYGAKCTNVDCQMLKYRAKCTNIFCQILVAQLHKCSILCLPTHGWNYAQKNTIAANGTCTNAQFHGLCLALLVLWFGINTTALPLQLVNALAVVSVGHSCANLVEDATNKWNECVAWAWVWVWVWVGCCQESCRRYAADKRRTTVDTSWGGRPFHLHRREGVHSAFAICHLAFGIQHLAFGICHLSFGIWHLAFTIWSWRLAFDIWYRHVYSWCFS